MYRLIDRASGQTWSISTGQAAYLERRDLATFLGGTGYVRLGADVREVESALAISANW